jgi:transcriptional regulator with XRE-family HTH domain
VEDIQKRIGERVRTLRKAAGFTQDVFAERAGLNRAHMGEIERGEQNVTIQTLKIIADALGCRIVDLLEGM